MAAPQVFLSYRRGSDELGARAIADDLNDAFWKGAVFLDVEEASKELGVDFHDLLHDRVAECALFLAVIGPGWIEATPRLQREDDWVRIEVASALARSDLRVIPVLISGVEMPKEDDLPDDLKPLARRQFLKVRSEDYRSDLQKLVNTLRPILRPKARLPFMLAGLSAMVLATGVLFKEEIIDARCAMAEQPWEIAYCG